MPLAAFFLRRVRAALAFAGVLFLSMHAPSVRAQALELPPPEGAEHGEEALPAPSARTAAKKSETTEKPPAHEEAPPATQHANDPGEESRTEEGAHGTKDGASGEQSEKKPPHTGGHGPAAKSSAPDAAHDNAEQIDEGQPAKQEPAVGKGSGLIWFGVAFVALVIAIFVLT